VKYLQRLQHPRLEVHLQLLILEPMPKSLDPWAPPVKIRWLVSRVLSHVLHTHTPHLAKATQPMLFDAIFGHHAILCAPILDGVDGRGAKLNELDFPLRPRDVELVVVLPVVEEIEVGQVEGAVGEEEWAGLVFGLRAGVEEAEDVGELAGMQLRTIEDLGWVDFDGAVTEDVVVDLVAQLCGETEERRGKCVSLRAGRRLAR
jgi:hypothetical protein